MRTLTRTIIMLTTAALVVTGGGVAQANTPHAKKPSASSIKTLKEMNALVGASSDVLAAGGTISGTSYVSSMSVGSKGARLETTANAATVTLSVDATTQSIQMRVSTPNIPGVDAYEATYIQNSELLYMPLSVVLKSLSPAPTDEQRQAITAKASELAPGVTDPWVTFTDETDDLVFGLVFGSTFILAASLPSELEAKAQTGALQKATKSANATGGQDYKAVFNVGNTRVNGKPVKTMTVTYSTDASGTLSSSSTRYGNTVYSQSSMSTAPVTVTVPTDAIAYTDLTTGL